MNRARYLKHLEHDVDLSRKVINELTQELFELKQLLISSQIESNDKSNHHKETSNDSH